MTIAKEQAPLLAMKNVHIEARSGDSWLPIVNGIDLTLNRGEVLGLIGESGAGKSTLGLAAMGYARDGCRISAGTISFDGIDLISQSDDQRRAILGRRISCIQFPESGRETRYGVLKPAPQPKRVMVIGGGPGGMKAAITAAKRGHQVSLYEGESQLGGQAKLAQLLPRRSEFGGIITNLSRELELQQVHVSRNTWVDRALITKEMPDVVILAAGAKPYVPDLPSDDTVKLVDAWQILRKEVKPGRRVVVADWRNDWIGPGIAEMLMKEGSHVELAVNGTHPASALPLYVRDDIAAELHRLSINITPYARLFGVDSSTVYMQHTASGEPIIFEDVDMVVLCHGHRPFDDLMRDLKELSIEAHSIGDCLGPRTAEEAVYEGLKIGCLV